jgi:hypothetical protein
MARRPAAGQLDLLDWTPPNPVARFDDRDVRSSTFEGRLSRAISVSLQTCGLSREEIAQRMSQHLGRPVSLNILNAYASPQRETHQISVPRFAALLHATQDRRLIEFLAEPLGWAAVERGYLPLIELAAIQERQQELRRRAAGLRHHVVRATGG